MLLEFMTFVYGWLIARLSGEAVTISSADIGSWIQACGLLAATSEKRDHMAPISARWSSWVRPRS